MDKKYELTDETMEYNGHTLHRIVALKDFGDVNKGDKGGWVESENNLSQDGDCWVADDAKVYGEALICDEARVFGDARVCGNAEVYGEAQVCGGANIGAEAILSTGITESDYDYVVVGPQGSRHSYTTYHIPSDTVCTGCFAGTLKEFEEAVEKTHKGNAEHLRQYKLVISMFKTFKSHHVAGQSEARNH